MNDQEKILSYLKIIGPVLPAQVAKHISSNILLASAHLSELVSQGKIKVSKLKIGGSPLYYSPEQKEKLQNFIHNLNPKDQQTLNLLKERKILRERNLDLLTRVSLRNIKDFAVSLNVNLNGIKELFWKWYLLDEQQATNIIKSQLSPSAKTQPNSTPKPELPQPKLETPHKPETQLKETPPPKPTEPQPLQPKPKIQTSFESKQRKPFFQKLKEKIKPKRKTVPDQFFPQMDSFFQERDIKIETKETIRKNAEMNFILKVPSVVGKLTYFCKAKNKKRCDEKDLSAAYMEAQAKKLPLLFLYTNDLTKRAQEMLDSGAFENMVIKKLD